MVIGFTSEKLMNDVPTFSIIAPCYNEKNNIALFCSTVKAIAEVSGADLHELILIDDGSTDSTWEEIEQLKQSNPEIVGLRLSRNFGKEAAIFAGLKRATRDFVITIDADLQHPPEVIPEMIKLWKEGYRIVNTKKISSKDLTFHSIGRNTFFMLSKKLTNLTLKESSDFKLLDKKIVSTFIDFHEFHLFYRGLVDWIGFKRTTLKIQTQERISGKSSFTLTKLITLAKTGIISFTAAPLHLVTSMAFIFFIIAIILGSITLYRKFLGEAIDGFTTVILLQLLIGAIIMFSLGLIGEYLGRVYDESKKRPRYIIDEEI